MRFAIATALLILLLTPLSGGSFAVQRVTFRTDDGITLAGSWFEPSVRPAPAVVLVHMFRRSRHDWESFAPVLAAQGIGVLTFDLRGHGESPGVIGQDLAPLVADVRAARRFLTSRGDVSGRVGIGGASLGANLALIEAADDPTVAAVALLSPSLDYRGLRIESAAKKYGNRPMLIVSSDDDGYAMRTSRDLQKGTGPSRESMLLSHAGHGTTMLARAPDLMRSLVDWFRRTLL
jgi:alpha-beta hydrolase superfamily lysophospholipase